MDYTKFFDKNGDCKAYYKKQDGIWQRLGANEFNNVERCLDSTDVEFARSLLGIDFSLLKTEAETMQDVYLPE